MKRKNAVLRSVIVGCILFLKACVFKFPTFNITEFLDESDNVSVIFFVILCLGCTVDV